MSPTVPAARGRLRNLRVARKLLPGLDALNRRALAVAATGSAQPGRSQRRPDTTRRAADIRTDVPAEIARSTSDAGAATGAVQISASTDRPADRPARTSAEQPKSLAMFRH
jgi:hypothetical protein